MAGTQQITPRQQPTGSGGSGIWGFITGTLSNQTDLQAALDAKYDTSNPAGYLTSIGSADVINALGYVPYDSSNPNNYITSADIPTALSAFTNDVGFITGISSADVIAALGYVPYDASNPNGYLTGITAGMISTALGFAPYNDANPAGYITASSSDALTNKTGNISQWTNNSGYLTGITSGQVTTALGFTPVTNARTISTTAPITGGGDLTANRTLAIPKATTGVDGYLAATDFTIFNNKYDSSNFNDDWRQVTQGLGSVILYESAGVPLWICTVTVVITSGTAIYQPVYIRKAQNITGVKWWQTVAGVYTADTSNVVGLFTYSGGTLTLVASSADDGTIWKTTANTMGLKAFNGGVYAAAAGLYYIGILYHTSSQSTQPQILGATSLQNANNSTSDFTNSAKLYASKAAQTSLATVAMSTLSLNSQKFWLSLY